MAIWPSQSPSSRRSLDHHPPPVDRTFERVGSVTGFVTAPAWRPDRPAGSIPHAAKSAAAGRTSIQARAPAVELTGVSSGLSTITPGGLGARRALARNHQTAAKRRAETTADTREELEVAGVEPAIRFVAVGLDPSPAAERVAARDRCDVADTDRPHDLVPAARDVRGHRRSRCSGSPAGFARSARTCFAAKWSSEYSSSSGRGTPGPKSCSATPLSGSSVSGSAKGQHQRSKPITRWRSAIASRWIDSQSRVDSLSRSSRSRQRVRSLSVATASSVRL